MLLPSLVEGHGGGPFIIMTVIDIVILVFIGIGTVWGMMKGFIRQLSSLVGLIVGLLVARALFVEVGDWVAPAIGVSVTIGRVLAFFMLWIMHTSARLCRVRSACLTISLLPFCLVPYQGVTSGTPRLGQPLAGWWLGSHQVYAFCRHGRPITGICGHRK